MTRVYRLNHACVVCGSPCGRAGARCADCSSGARKARIKAYMPGYHERTRPAPAPVPQNDPALPPHGVIVTDDERIQCHACGRWYRALATHVKMHGLDAVSYKAQYGLARGSSLLGPAAAEKQRQAALARDQGAIGRAVLVEIGPSVHPPGIGLRRQSRIAQSVAKRREPS